MSTASLRRDHQLIEKVLKSMATAVGLLEAERQVPHIVIRQVVDFAKNFTDACHHTKEEESLFPALQKAGMPARMGPIAVMLMEHKRARLLAGEMERGAQQYESTGRHNSLASSMREYVRHLTEHLRKENNRLFLMAEARLQHAAADVDRQLQDVELRQLKDIGRDREYYERLAADIEGMMGSHST